MHPDINHTIYCLGLLSISYICYYLIGYPDKDGMCDYESRFAYKCQSSIGSVVIMFMFCDLIYRSIRERLMKCVKFIDNGKTKESIAFSLMYSIISIYTIFALFKNEYMFSIEEDIIRYFIATFIMEQAKTISVYNTGNYVASTFYVLISMGLSEILALGRFYTETC